MREDDRSKIKKETSRLWQIPEEVIKGQDEILHPDLIPPPPSPKVMPLVNCTACGGKGYKLIGSKPAAGSGDFRMKKTCQACKGSTFQQAQ